MKKILLTIFAAMLLSGSPGPQQQQPLYTLKLTEPEVQYVVNELAKKPYGEVYVLIDKITSQMAVQMMDTTRPAPVKDSTKPKKK